MGFSFRKKRNTGDNDGDETGTSRDHLPAPNENDEAATETTRLLVRNVEPTVEPSPYNLRVVRSLRNISIFLTVATLIWWTTMFVSVFFSVPGLYTRGSGFTALAYAFLTVSVLINSIMFFGTPLPRGVRALSLTLGIFLFFNAIFILLSPHLRHHEGWVGLASVLWAAAVGGIWTVVTDRVVEWGKAEEEERLIGRVEDRYTGTEWLKVILATVGLVIVVALEVFITLTLILRLGDESLPPRGNLYWVQSHKYQVHIACFGNASSNTPLVLVEGGETGAEYFSTWVDEAKEEGRIGQYCYWDRPGFGYSDNAPSPMSAGAAIDALSEALPEANISETGAGWILVSHGVGGLYSFVFASRHASQVKGLLLVDAIPESLIPKIFTPGRTFVLLLRGIVSPLGVDRLFGWIFKHRSRQDRVSGVSSWRSDRAIKSRLQESFIADSITRNEVIAARAIIPKNIGVAVVSSGIRCKEKEWQEGQRELAMTKRAKKQTWDIIGNADHDVWKDEEGKVVLKKRLEELVRGATT